jgi:hypothetical protein
VFREIVAAEDRVTREARAGIPDSDFMKQAELQWKLMQRYKRHVARKYALTEDKIPKITLEGIKKGWPH